MTSTGLLRGHVTSVTAASSRTLSPRSGDICDHVTCPVKPPPDHVTSHRDHLTTVPHHMTSHARAWDESRGLPHRSHDLLAQRAHLRSDSPSWRHLCIDRSACTPASPSDDHQVKSKLRGRRAHHSRRDSALRRQPGESKRKKVEPAGVDIAFVPLECVGGGGSFLPQSEALRSEGAHHCFRKRLLQPEAFNTSLHGPCERSRALARGGEAERGRGGGEVEERDAL